MTASKRRYAARAEASDTCCSRMIWISVPKPGSRAQSGGPNRATTAARSRSRAESATTPVASVSSLSWAALTPTGCGRARELAVREPKLQLGEVDVADRSPLMRRSAPTRAIRPQVLMHGERILRSSGLMLDADADIRDTTVHTFTNVPARDVRSLRQGRSLVAPDGDRSAAGTHPNGREFLSISCDAG